DGLERLSVLVRDPLPANGARHAVVGVDEVEAGEATAGRMFRLLVPCPSATQFVGYIPPGRAPDHYHRYDEVVYVLEGNGALHIDGESTPLRPGSCVHLPAKLVHSLENHGPGEMQVLGVFSPAGSKAADMCTSPRSWTRSPTPRASTTTVCATRSRRPTRAARSRSCCVRQASSCTSPPAGREPRRAGSRASDA